MPTNLQPTKCTKIWEREHSWFYWKDQGTQWQFDKENIQTQVNFQEQMNTKMSRTLQSWQKNNHQCPERQVCKQKLNYGTQNKWRERKSPKAYLTSGIIIVENQKKMKRDPRKVCLFLKSLKQNYAKLKIKTEKNFRTCHSFTLLKSASLCTWKGPWSSWLLWSLRPPTSPFVPPKSIRKGEKEKDEYCS